MAISTIKNQHLNNIKSIELVTRTVTTGNTGNIHSAYDNDGKTAIIAPYVYGANVTLIPFVSGINGAWYLKARDTDSNNPVVNTSLAIRFYVLKMV